MFMMFNAVSIIVLLFTIIVTYYYYIHHNISKPEKMANNGILFVSNAAKAHKYFTKVSKYIKKILYVSYNETTDNMLSVINKHSVDIYSKTSQFNNLDVRLILKPRDNLEKIKTNHPIDLILYEADGLESGDTLKNRIENPRNSNVCGVPLQDEDMVTLTSFPYDGVTTYEYVALGGTFDRLHSGHKILLSQAVLRTTRHVTVGVTDINMIKSKILWELIEPVENRIKKVLDFLTDINPDLEYNVLPIQDLYGPAKDDPKLKLIVVSEETVRGAAKINEKRKENGLDPLDVYTISLAEDEDKLYSIEETKVSSSNQRIRLLGSLLKEPKTCFRYIIINLKIAALNLPVSMDCATLGVRKLAYLLHEIKNIGLPLAIHDTNTAIPKWPYVIGLTGGIASGKSNIAEKLRLKGAAIVNCDLIAHELYKPGQPLNSTVAETFGADVLNAAGEVDRRRLGQIVFADKKQLEKLNRIMWPAILEEAQRRIRALGERGVRVVVMEAAVMIEAKWYHQCHQLWAVIIPPEEAVKRLQERNKLTKEEAKLRVDAQPSNLEQIAEANVVFSPFWSYEFTQTQIDRAWERLTKTLEERA